MTSWSSGSANVAAKRVRAATAPVTQTACRSGRLCDVGSSMMGSPTCGCREVAGAAPGRHLRCERDIVGS